MLLNQSELQVKGSTVSQIRKRGVSVGRWFAGD
jgi:hypothetical protein